MWKTLCLVSVLVFGLLSVGCGGGGSSSVTPANEGRISFTVKWPTRSRLVPYNTQTIVVTITGGPTSVSPIPLTPSVTNYTSPLLGVGSYTIGATSYPGSGSSLGVALASGNVNNVSITGGQTTPITLTMATDLTQIGVTLSQTGQADQTATVLSTTPFTQTPSTPLTIIPTLPAKFSVTPYDSTNVLYLFPNPTGNPLQIGTASNDAIQLQAGLVANRSFFTPNLLLFFVSPTATGTTGFNVNYWEPTDSNAAVSAMPVAVSVGNVTPSVTPTLALVGTDSAITDVTYDAANGPTYLVTLAGNQYITTNLVTPALGTEVTTAPMPASLLANVSSGKGYYGSTSSATIETWAQTGSLTLAGTCVDLDTTPGDSAYVLNNANTIDSLTIGSNPFLATLTGTPAHFAVGNDFNVASPTTNRVVYWIDSSGALRQTFTSPAAADPVFGANVPTNVLAVAEANNCPLTFIIVGTSLEAISQTGTVVGTIALPATNAGSAIVYTHLAVQITPSGAVTGAAVGHDSVTPTPNPVAVTF